MNTLKHPARNFTAGLLAVVCWAAFCGCIYDSPITARPTRKVDEKFLGNWTSQDGKVKMMVARYDASNYVVLYDGELYHAWHSDVAGTPFLTVQLLDSTEPANAYKFTYSTWTLADDGTLHGRGVNDQIIPDATKGSASVQKLLKQNGSSAKFVPSLMQT